MSVTELSSARALDRFAADVRESLTRHPRELPSQYFYDTLGSALFDAICHLPWYAVTRAEHRLLARHASRVVSRDCRTLVELGPGSGSKMASLLSQVCPDGRPLAIHLVDVSEAALAQATQTVERFGGVQVVRHCAAYDDGLEAFRGARGAGRAVALFLGSNIGNFAPADALTFLGRIRTTLRSGDGFLLGADLVKPERQLIEAYDDPLGVTAAFNRNLLVRLNRELGATIDLSAFRHRAVWNRDDARIEMHLVSLRSQRIVVPGAGVDVEMAEGETIWTESSHKYEPSGVRSMLDQSGFVVSSQWLDEEDGFALTYALVP